MIQQKWASLLTFSQRILRIDSLATSRGRIRELRDLPELPEKQYRSIISCPILLGLAGLNCLLQIFWFWRYTGRNINFDAISYIGIARHLADGDFRASLHGYWSPLI